MGGKARCFQTGTIPDLRKASQTVPAGLSEGELLEVRPNSSQKGLIVQAGHGLHLSLSGSFNPSGDQGRFCQE